MVVRGDSTDRQEVHRKLKRKVRAEKMRKGRRSVQSREDVLLAYHRESGKWEKKKKTKQTSKRFDRITEDASFLRPYQLPLRFSSVQLFFFFSFALTRSVAAVKSRVQFLQEGRRLNAEAEKKQR